MTGTSRTGAQRLWHVTQVRLDDVQWEQLQQLMDRDHTQAPTIFRQALDLFYKTRETPPQQQ